MKHVNWKNEARPYLKSREMSLKWWEALWQLDYGGLNDSNNDKVAVWSVTVMAPNRQQENFDYFFDQASSKNPAGAGAAKKDGQTGIFFLDDMLDPKKSPYNDGVCIYEHFYPKTSHFLASGDTGNGYRAYAMLDKLSRIHGEYGYTVELSPLAPGHAWNRTDARIAHMNTFLGALKAVTRVFGARGVSKEFHKATNINLKNRRKYMARSHIFCRDVHVDHKKAEAERKNIGCMLESEDLDGGKMGVRGLGCCTSTSLSWMKRVWSCTLRATPGFVSTLTLPGQTTPHGCTRGAKTWQRSCVSSAAIALEDRWR
jgi:hypothetical protein